MIFRDSNLHVNTLRVSNVGMDIESFDANKLSLPKTSLAEDIIEVENTPINDQQIADARNILMSKNAIGFFEYKGEENTNMKDVLSQYNNTSKAQKEIVFATKKWS
ncbi:hypothetical protein [Candidatus Epulonipiscium viviparus]|uniref:hypothetical protein n=1 Tax=Candidatus Epulonipiscium viviparus TaxID=420336 RepID=UPI00016C05FD|nr:hypothetical protein [Candidatus Epulopiscium viviparus]